MNVLQSLQTCDSHIIEAIHFLIPPYAQSLPNLFLAKTGC